MNRFGQKFAQIHKKVCKIKKYELKSFYFTAFHQKIEASRNKPFSIKSINLFNLKSYFSWPVEIFCQYGICMATWKAFCSRLGRPCKEPRGVNLYQDIPTRSEVLVKHQLSMSDCNDVNEKIFSC